MNRRRFLQLAGLSVASPWAIGRQAPAQNVPNKKATLFDCQKGIPILLIVEAISPFTQGELEISVEADGVIVSDMHVDFAKAPKHILGLPETFNQQYFRVITREKYVVGQACPSFTATFMNYPNNNFGEHCNG